MSQSRQGLIAEKQCTQCHQTKFVTDFDYDKNNRRYSSRCKACRRAAQTEENRLRKKNNSFWIEAARAGGVWKLVEQAAKEKKE